jgi:hypothetical protein
LAYASGLFARRPPSIDHKRHGQAGASLFVQHPLREQRGASRMSAIFLNSIFVISSTLYPMERLSQAYSISWRPWHLRFNEIKIFAQSVSACGSMVLYRYCVSFFAPLGEKRYTRN